MKQHIFLPALAAFCLLGYTALADENSNIEALTKMLTSSYGADVAVEVNQDKCSVTYPEVTIEEEVPEYIEPKNPDEEPQTEIKKVTTTVPAIVAQCAKTEDFDEHAQYQITNNSPHKLIAQLYNVFGFAFIKDINIKDYSEEIQLVPEIGLVSMRKTHLGEASYTETDETTGLKSEIGNLKDYELSQEVSQEGEKLKYRFGMNLDTLNLVLPIFSLQLQSEKNLAEIEYALPKDEPFDYTNISQNIEHLLSAKSSAVGHGIKIGINLFDMGINLDTNIKNSTSREEDGTIRTMGTLLLHNIALSGDMLSKEKQPKSIELKYALKDIPVKTLGEMSKLYQTRAELMEKAETFEDLQAAKNANDEQLAEFLDEVAQQAKLTASFEVKFADAAVAMDSVFERKKGFLYGVSKIKITNLYNIFPEQKQCLNNPKADEIPACAFDFMFSAIKDYVDTDKDSSETVYKYTEQGVYKNDIKIDEPVELSFKKMYQEKLQKDKEREEMFRKMMEEQAIKEEGEDTPDNASQQDESEEEKASDETE